MQSEGPFTSDPVLLTNLSKGDLFFIRQPRRSEAQLAILISEPTDDPIHILYRGYHSGQRTYFYKAEVPDLKTFRVYPPDYTNPEFEKIREQLFPRRLGKAIDERVVVRQGLGKKYYFKEDHDLYVLGKLEYMRISQFGDIDIMYREEPSPDFPEGRPHRRNYSPGYKNPYIYEYREPPPSRLNILRQGNAIIERNGPEGGIETIKYHIGKAALNERAPLIKFYYNKLKAEREKWEEEEAKRASEVGGGSRRRRKRRQTKKKN